MPKSNKKVIYRGYYTAARKYNIGENNFGEIYGENNILRMCAQRVSKILFLTREERSSIFKPTCNVLFII